jgi:hypothetical protein
MAIAKWRNKILHCFFQIRIYLFLSGILNEADMDECKSASDIFLTFCRMDYIFCTCLINALAHKSIN